MPPLLYSRYRGAEARPDRFGALALTVRERVVLEPAADDIYVDVLEGDSPASVAARAWAPLLIRPNTDAQRPEGFSPAELGWLVLDLIEADDPLVPLTGGQRLRLPSAQRLRLEVLRS